MATAPTRPTNIDLPFAYAGTRNVIPDAPTGTNKASFNQGFPPITMLPLTSGGIPPDGDDFNGLLFDITSHTLWVNAGGQYLFDAALSTAMGGYPKGMVLQNTALNASYISLVDNNTTDFNSTPASIGTLWGSYAGAAFSNTAITTTGGTTTLSAIQALADMITITGVLTSNSVLVFPAAIGEHLIINNTTGAFMLSATITGAGVQIKQGFADAIYSDGTNIGYQQNSAINKGAKDVSRSIANTFYADRAADRSGGGYVDTGAVDAYVVATVPASTAPADYQTVRFRAAHNSSGGAATLDIGGGPVSMVTGDGNNPRPNDITNTAITTATYVAAIGKWVVNGLIVPDILISNAIYVTATQTLIKGNFIFNTAAGAFGCNLNATPNIGDTIYGADPTGSWKANPLTIAATGGKNIVYTDRYSVNHTMTTYVDDVGGHTFTLVYNGTDWRLS